MRSTPLAGFAQRIYSARCIAKDRNIQYRLWERSESHIGIHDIVVIVYGFSLAGLITPRMTKTPSLTVPIPKPSPCFAVRHYAFIRNNPLAFSKQVPGYELKIIEDRLNQYNLR